MAVANVDFDKRAATIEGDGRVTSRGLHLTVKETGYNVDLGAAVDFYAVSLVCGADPDRACGHRAPPVLEELESATEVSEAWLNRESTVMALVWSDPNAINRSALNLLKQNPLETKTLSGVEREKAISSFVSDRIWYRGAAIAQLDKQTKTNVSDSD